MRIVYGNYILLLLMAVVLASCGGILQIPNTGNDGPTPTPRMVGSADSGNVTVTVKDEGGQNFTSGVVIRVTRSNQADDFDNGELRVGPCASDQVIVAWAPGYQTSFTRCAEDTNHYDITLYRVATPDDPNYGWLMAGNETDTPPNCATCHAGQRDPTHNEVIEWRKSGHAKVFSNRFAFYDLMRQKGWDRPEWARPDIEVTSKTWTCVHTPSGFNCGK